MKKFLSLVLLVLVASYLGLTYLAGSNFTEQLQKIATSYQEDYKLQVKQNNLSSGFFASKGQLVLEVELENNLLLTLTAPWQAKHLPGFITYASQVTLEVTDSFETLNINQVLGLPSFEVTGKGSFNKLSYQQKITQLTTEIEDLKLVLSDWLLKGNLYYSGKDEGSLSLAKLKAASDGEELNINNLKLNFNQQGKFPWQKAKFNFALASLNLDAKHASYSLGASELNVDYQLNEQEFNLNYLLNLKQFENDDVQLDAARLNTQLKLSGKEMAFILEALKQEASQGTASKITDAEIKQHLFSILAASPRLEVKELSYNLIKPMQMNPSAKGWLEFNGKDLPESFLDLAEFGIIDEQELMNRIEVEVNLKNLPSLVAGLLALQGIELDPKVEEHQVRLSNGKLLLNGQVLN